MKASKRDTRKYVRKCPNCGRKLVKNGLENNKQRWRCLNCGTARIYTRQDTTLRNQAKVRKKYLLSKQTGSEISKTLNISRRTFDRKYMSGIVGSESETTHNNLIAQYANYITIDATNLYFGVVAIARSETGCMNWDFASLETSAVWIRIFNSFTGVKALVSDGQKGIQKAARLCFGDTLVMQRCHFHVKQNLRTKLTRNPKTKAGQDLSNLAEQICQVKNYDHMALFIGVFYDLYEIHGAFLRERTYYTTLDGKKRWNYTHKQVRSAYRQIADLIETDQLFAYITHPELKLPNTTNSIEGGVNSRIKELIRSHRGLLPARQKELVGMFLHDKDKNVVRNG